MKKSVLCHLLSAQNASMEGIQLPTIVKQNDVDGIKLLIQQSGSSLPNAKKFPTFDYGYDNNVELNQFYVRLAYVTSNDEWEIGQTVLTDKDQIVRVDINNAEMWHKANARLIVATSDIKLIRNGIRSLSLEELQLIVKQINRSKSKDLIIFLMENDEKLEALLLKETFSRKEAYDLGLVALGMGMTIRQDQLSGSGSDKSGNEIYNQWFNETY